MVYSLVRVEKYYRDLVSIEKLQDNAGEMHGKALTLQNLGIYIYRFTVFETGVVIVFTHLRFLVAV